VITLRTRDAAAARAMLKEKLAIDADDAAADDSTLRLERPRGHEFIPALIEALPGLVESVSVGKPTLEDVFVHMTGRRFRAREADEAIAV
jgi:ABC-2 type transport system ATP-binding protein